jgi:hypothetical protein
MALPLMLLGAEEQQFSPFCVLQSAGIVIEGGLSSGRVRSQEGLQELSWHLMLVVFCRKF